jgi:hypothetical protein
MVQCLRYRNETNETRIRINLSFSDLRIGDNEKRLHFLAWFSVQFETDNLFYYHIL